MSEWADRDEPSAMNGGQASRKRQEPRPYHSMACPPVCVFYIEPLQLELRRDRTTRDVSDDRGDISFVEDWNDLFFRIKKNLIIHAALIIYPQLSEQKI